MRLRSRDHEDPELNVISLVDIVLLLLIFFMLSTKFVDESRIELQLPPEGANPASDEQELPVTTVRRVRAGRRVLLTVPAHEATSAVAWATTLRAADRIDGYTLTPATLEDAYLSLTSIETDEVSEPAATRKVAAHV